MPRAAPSRDPPAASQDLEAGPVLKLGEYTDEPTLNTSEARLILIKTLETRRQRDSHAEETETLTKTRDYLEIFAVFKELGEAQQVESIIDTYGKDLARFEKSQLGEWCREKEIYGKMSVDKFLYRDVGADLCRRGEDSNSESSGADLRF